MVLVVVDPGTITYRCLLSLYDSHRLLPTAPTVVTNAGRFNLGASLVPWVMAIIWNYTSRSNWYPLMITAGSVCAAGFSACFFVVTRPGYGVDPI